MINRRALEKIDRQYDPDHDLGPDAPIHWSVAELAELVGKLCDRVEALETEIENMNNRFEPRTYDDASDR